MIDLKKLEEQLDELLANETDESFAAWFENYNFMHKEICEDTGMHVVYMVCMPVASGYGVTLTQAVYLFRHGLNWV